MTRLILIAAALAPVATNAFSPIAPISKPVTFVSQQSLFAEVEDKASESVFLPSEETSSDEEDIFAKAESLGKGSAKVCSC